MNRTNIQNSFYNVKYELGTAPKWPFTGLVQLWYSYLDQTKGYDRSYYGGYSGWTLRFLDWDNPSEKHTEVLLPELEIECSGQIGLLADSENGVQLGGLDGAASIAYQIPWGGDPQPIAAPSRDLLELIRQRPSNVDVNSEGDWVHIASGTQQRSYAMRDPARPEGERWVAWARHDGGLFMLTVHPAEYPCYSGYTWISLAETGRILDCGTNTAATAFVAK